MQFWTVNWMGWEEWHENDKILLLVPFSHHILFTMFVRGVEDAKIEVLLQSLYLEFDSQYMRDVWSVVYKFV
ncbi:hypothetical protein RchiOBHm_Chr2g0169601 [Rosa chinensis]|uniref:Uncharacterized protein n=1 Tax=Rosa chinensis TaxID=74649 RepID=A0A2P6S4W8_ROSCH|nr:hypothetical protein RchiOBHm_Chr2g0169601 [Rosa chinensis]